MNDSFPVLNDCRLGRFEMPNNQIIKYFQLSHSSHYKKHNIQFQFFSISHYYKSSMNSNSAMI